MLNAKNFNFTNMDTEERERERERDGWSNNSLTKTQMHELIQTNLYTQAAKKTFLTQ